nr:Ig-like domain-containing protein [Alysiella crassa]UOP05849.1 Ig-like domain-containing protein [Alysiella crassa]
MSQYVLNITQNNHTKTVHLVSNQQTVKVVAEAGARYQILNDKGVLVLQPKVQEMGADLWVFLDGAKDSVPDIIIQGYGDFSPIINEMSLQQMEATLALTNTPSAMPLMPTNVASVPESVALTASEVSTAPAALAEPVSSAATTAATETATTTATTASSTAAGATSSFSAKRLLGGVLVLALMGGGAAAAVNAARDDDDEPAVPNPAAPEVTLNAVAGDNVINQNEATGTFPISGSVNGARDGDVVRVLVDGVEIAATTVLNDTFSVDVSGSLLANAATKTLTVEVVATNEQGGSTTSSVAANYELAVMDEPSLVVNTVAGDNIVNMAEAAQDVVVSGVVSGARDGDTVTIKLDNQAVATATVVNGAFSVNIAGSLLANANTKTITAEVLATDTFGNSVLASVEQGYAYQTLAKPVISNVNIAGDNILDKTETAANVAVSGSVSGAKDGDTVEIILDNQVVATTQIAKDGFTAQLAGSLLAKAANQSITVHVATSDAVGNEQSASVSQTYTVPTLDKPTISNLKIAGDNLLSMTEAAAEVAISGSVSGANNGDTVNIIIDNQTVTTAMVANGVFSVNVSGSLLANANTKTVIAEVLVQDKYGNQEVGKAEQSYTAPTLAAPTINQITISGDNHINEMEATQEVAITGKVQGARPDDVVEVWVDGKMVATTKVVNDGFSVNVAGSVLANAANPSVMIGVLATDNYGNSVRSEQIQVFELNQLNEPKIELNPLTANQDNLINKTELAANIALSGSLQNVADGTMIEIKLDDKVLTTATAAAGTFTVEVVGSLLKDGKTVLATVVVRDDFGNEKSASSSQTYTVQTEAVAPKVVIDVIAENDVLNAAEAAVDVAISGSVEGAKTGDVVELLLDGKVVATTTVANGGGFTQFVSGKVLAAATTSELTVRVSGKDAAGNDFVGEGKRDYDVQTQLPEPKITLDVIAGDNVLNGAEAAADVRISGTLENVKDGDTVEIWLDNQKVTETQAANNAFSVNIAGSLLAGAQDTTLMAKVSTQDAHGNSATAMDTESYAHQPRAAMPEVSLDKITFDNVINAQEAAGNITITGKTSLATGKEVELLLDGKVVGKVAVAGGRFSTELAGSLFVNASDKTLTVQATNTDSAGNTATATAKRTFSVHNELSNVTITLDKVTNDETINGAEAQSPITISGSTTGARIGDTVELLLDGNKVADAVVGADGKFGAVVQGSVLINATTRTLTAKLAATDDFGNAQNAETTKDYKVELSAETPVISLNYLTEDNIINATEAVADVTVSGKVQNVQDADVIELLLDGKVITTTTSTQGVFSVNIAGSLLEKAAESELVARVSTTSAAGNTASRTATNDYEVDTTAPQPTIVLTAISDGTLNAAESAAQVLLTGTVDGARVGDVVKLTLENGDVLGETKVLDGGEFNLSVAGSLFAAQQGSRTITAEVFATDVAGNTGNATTTQKLLVDTIAPDDTTAQLDKITGDDILNMTDDVNQIITVSGSTSVERAGNQVHFTVGKETFSTTVGTDGAFSVGIAGSLLTQNTQIVYKIDAVDTAGNAATVSFTHDYQVVSLAAPSVKNLLLANDNRLNETEAKGNVSLSGEVVGARNDDKVNIVVDGKTIANAVVQDGTFTVNNLSGELLANAANPVITVEVIATDTANNRVTGSGDVAYTLSTLMPPVLSDLNLADDKVLNSTEAAGKVWLSGKVSGARENDVLTISLNGKEIATGKVLGNAFSVELDGATLAAANSKELQVSVLATDDSGNAKAGNATIAYDVKTLSAPEITFTVANDDKLTNKEATETVQVSGTAVGAKVDDVVRVLLGGVEIGTGKVVSGSQFTIDVSGKTLADATDKTLTVSVLATDTYGNSTLGEKNQSYEMASLTTPNVEITAIAGTDFVLSAAEAAAQVAVSGTVLPAYDGNAVRVLLGDKEIGTGTVAKNAFTVEVSSADLIGANAKQITVEVLVKDEHGNEEQGRATHAYSLDTLAAPIVNLSDVSGDKVLNAKEVLADVAISGTVSGARDGDTVNIIVDDKTVTTTTVAAGVFSVNVSGSLLQNAATKAVTAQVLATDVLGNQTAGTAVAEYRLENLAAPIVNELHIADDNILNGTEQAAAAVAISGKVSGANDGAVVTLLLDGATLTTTTVAAGAFSVNVAGSALAAAQSREITATVLATDNYGNEATGSLKQAYELKDLAAPVISEIQIAEDGFLNQTEQQAEAVQVVGKVSGAQENDVVRVLLAGVEIGTGKVVANAFAVSVSGSQLAAASDKTLTVEVLATDTAQNTTTGSATAAYELKNLAAPSITLAEIAGNDVLSPAEAAANVAIAGTVSGAKDGDTVNIIVDGKTVTTTQVVAGKFTVDVSGSLLKDAVAKTVTVEVLASDEFGNTTAGTSEKTYTVSNLLAPEITLNAIAGDAILDVTEAAGNVAISGSVAARDGDTVNIIVDGKTATTTTVSSGTFTVDVSGSLLKDAVEKSVNVEVITTDGEGSSVTATQVGSYQLAKLAAPTVTIVSIAGDEKVLNKAESTEMVAISGTVMGAREADKVRVLLDGKEIGTGEVSATNTFSVSVAGSLLAKDGVATSGEITVEVTATDVFNQTEVGTITAEYQIKTKVSEPTIELDDISGDGYLNMNDLNQGMIQITGRVDNASANAKVTLKLGETVLGENIAVVNGRFSVGNISTFSLTNGTEKTITATVEMTDDAGNAASATTSKSYQVVDNINAPTVEVDTIATDGYLNAAEAAATEIVITGTVTTQPIAGMTTTEKVNLTIGEYKATVDVVNGKFSHAVTGAVLQAASTVKAVAITTDLAGNTAESAVVNKDYVVDLLADKPIITLNPIAGNDVLSIAEAAAERINIIGSASNTQDGDKVVVTIGNKTYDTTIRNQGFLVTATGAELKAAAGEGTAASVKVSVVAHDVAGNSVLAEYTHDYQVVGAADIPVLTVNKPIAGDNIINKTESTQIIRLTGVAENAQDGQVTATVNGKEFYGRVQPDKTYWVDISGADLVADKNKTISLTVVREVFGGESTTASITATYDVDLEAPIPVIEMRPITADNTINYKESREAKITVSGSLQNVRESDDVKIVIGNNTYKGKVANNGFAIDVPGSVLAAHSSMEVTVTGSDEAANLSPTTIIHEYKVDTVGAVATILVNEITSDNTINLRESQEAAILVTGSTTGARENDKVELVIGTHTVTGSVLANGQFSIEVAGSHFLNNNQVQAALTATDEAGNESTAQYTRPYQVDDVLDKPKITIDNLTGDNIINLKDSTETITITGHASPARVGDTVVLQLGNLAPVNGKILDADGKFSLQVAGADLAKYTQFTVTVNNSDAAENQNTGSHTHSYQVILDMTQPTVSLNMIAGDGVLNRDESMDTLQLTGKAENTTNGKVVLSVGSQTYSATVGADGTFTFNNVSGSQLASHAGEGNTGTVSVVLTATDPVSGNTATAESTQTYRVITEMKQPEIQLGTVSEDNIVSGAEAAAGKMVTLKGTVSNAKDGDKVFVYTGSSYTKHETAVKGNAYEIQIAGSELKENTQYQVEVIATDGLGNSVSSSVTGSYTVDVETSAPNITIDKQLFKRTQLDGTVTFTGTVSHDSDVDEKNVNIVVTLNGKNYPATLSGNKWTVSVQGKDLGAKWGENEVKVTATVMDSVGNQAIGTETGSYTAELAELQFDNITPDNIIVANEATEPNIRVTGKVVGDYQPNDEVSISLHSRTYTAAVNSNGTFSVDLPTDNLLVNGNTLKVFSSRTLDAYFITQSGGAEHKVNTEFTYYVKIATNIGMEVDPISEDNVLDKSDLANTMTAITGRLTSISDPEHDLKQVLRIRAIVNGNEYSTYTDGQTGAFVLQVNTIDVFEHPVENPNYGQMFRVEIEDKQDSFGNRILSSFNNVRYKTNLNGSNSWISARSADFLDSEDELANAVNHEDEDHHGVSDVSGSLHNAAEAYRAATISSHSASDDDSSTDTHYLNTPVDKSPYAPAPAEQGGDYVYKVAANSNPYAYAGTSESHDYEVVDNTTNNTVNETAASESEWTVAETHDLTENALAEKANAITEDENVDYAAVEAAAPNLMNSEIAASTTSSNAYAPSGLVNSEEWEHTAYQII